MHPEEIKAALRMKGFTLAALADELKRSRSMVTHVVHGHARSKDIELRISQILGKSRETIWKAKPSLRRTKLVTAGAAA
jgi:lambda repressor-like predicted transcriptional regulator